MAKQLIRFPGHMSRLLLRIIGMAVTFLFTFVVYVSGQVISTGRFLSKADSGYINPLYGPIYAYGMPTALFTIKGTIRSLADSTPVKNAKIIVQDSAKEVLVSSFTAANGSFSMTPMSGITVLAEPNNWILEVQDSLFLTKDTLISIPSYQGDTVDVELYLQKIPLAAKPIGGSDISKAAPSLQVRQEARGSIETSYVLPTSGQMHLALYGVNGRLVKTFLDRYESVGKHEASLGISGLPAGIYFLKLQTDTHMAITKISYTE